MSYLLAGIGRAYVLRRAQADPPELPAFSGTTHYTLSMATSKQHRCRRSFEAKLPGAQMPVALIGRLAIDHRAQGRRLGEAFLMDAMHRVADASTILGDHPESTRSRRLR